MREINITGKKMVHSRLFMLFIIPLFLNSCIHTGVMQTARTTNKGEAQIVVATGYPDITQFLVRYGVSESVDIGVKVNFLGLLVDVKYKFYNAEQAKITASIAPGIGYSAIVWIDYDYDFGGGADEYNLWQIHMPVYLSYHPTKKFALYLSPRYVFGFADNSEYHIYGGAVGMKIGNKFGVVMELNLGGIEPIDSGISQSFGIQGFHLGLHIKTSSK